VAANWQNTPARQGGTTSVRGMRVEVRGPSNPAVGVFTPPGTCPGRLRRHVVIGGRRLWTEPACREVRQQPGSGKASPRPDGRACRCVPEGSADGEFTAVRSNGPTLKYDRARKELGWRPRALRFAIVTVEHVGTPSSGTTPTLPSQGPRLSDCSRSRSTHIARERCGGAPQYFDAWLARHGGGAR
jgi:hypothetical protein